MARARRIRRYGAGRCGSAGLTTARRSGYLRGAPLLGDRAVTGVALGGGEVGCRVGAAAAVEAIRARPAGEPVAAAAAAQAVVARTARDVVAAAVAAQQIVAVPASQRVVVALGQQQVGAGTAGQRVLAAAADRDRHLDCGAVLSIADGDREDRGPAAPV